MLPLHAAAGMPKVLFQARAYVEVLCRRYATVLSTAILPVVLLSSFGMTQIILVHVKTMS